MTIAINTMAGAVALALCYVYGICRMDVLRFGQHKPAWVLLHIGLGASSASVLVHALTVGVDLQDAACLIAGAAWVLISASEMRDGVPSSWESTPVPLDTVPFERQT